MFLQIILPDFVFLIQFVDWQKAFDRVNWTKLMLTG